MSRRNRKWLAALLVISLAGSIHFLLHYRSEIVLDELVRGFSGGQYSVTTEDVDITYFPLSIRLEGFRLVPETEDPAVLAASCKRLDLQVQSMIGLLFRRTLDLTTLIVDQPEIVLQRKQKANNQKANRSIADVQHQLFDLFDLLKAENVRIRDGALRINEGNGISPSITYTSPLTDSSWKTNREHSSIRFKETPASNYSVPTYTFPILPSVSPCTTFISTNPTGTCKSIRSA